MATSENEQPVAQRPSGGSPSDSAQAETGFAPAQTPRAARTRTSGAWTAVAVGLLLCLAVLIFIIQNGHRARYNFLGQHWTMPQGVAILLAAVAGGLAVMLVGAARVLQLRVGARRTRRQARRR